MANNVSFLLAVLFVSILSCANSIADEPCSLRCQRCEPDICVIEFSNITDDLYIFEQNRIVHITDSIFGLEFASKITINITAQIIMSTDSSFYGANIYLNAKQIILKNTVISASGTILNGFRKAITEGGCSYASSGGYCGTLTPVERLVLDSRSLGYGSSDLKFWEMYTVGSGGKCSKLAGGGRIAIIAYDLLYFGQHSRINADGYPRKEHCEMQCTTYPSSGSGGYIYINTNNVMYYDQVKTIISANGGGDACDNQYGGSGGRIVIESPRAEDLRTKLKNFVSVKGGFGSPSFGECSNGLDGTIFFKTLNSI